MLTKKVLAVLLAGLFGFFLGFCFRIAIEGSSFVIAEWQEEPIVVVCPDSLLTPYRVGLAIEWWKIREFKIADFHFDQTNTICSKERFIEGIIFIRSDGSLDSEFYASTARFTIGSKLLAADVLLPNKNRNMPRLLEHELGHALGLGHVVQQGHMMHPFHEQGGERFWIPD